MKRILVLCMCLGIVLFSRCGSDGEVVPSGQGNFTVKNGDVDLAVKLWLPATTGKYPVVINVEGPESDPKEDFGPFAQLFNSGGVAVLAYDKRGNFSSTGTKLVPNVSNSVETFGLLSSDVLAIVAFLKTHTNIDVSRIGLFCTSQGVWIGAQAAAATSDIKFIANVVGSATCVGIEDYYSQLTGNDFDGNNLSNLTIQEIDNLVAQYDGPQGFDPLPYLKTMTIPQLWVLGEMDFGNPTRQSVVILDDLVTSFSKDITIIVVPNANHSLIDITTGEPYSIGTLITPWFVDKVL